MQYGYMWCNLLSNFSATLPPVIHVFGVNNSGQCRSNLDAKVRSDLRMQSLDHFRNLNCQNGRESEALSMCLPFTKLWAQAYWRCNDRHTSDLSRAEKCSTFPCHACRQFQVMLHSCCQTDVLISQVPFFSFPFFFFPFFFLFFFFFSQTRLSDLEAMVHFFPIASICFD